MEAFKIRPDSTDAVRGLAALALEQHDYSQAFEMHQRPIEMDDHRRAIQMTSGDVNVLR
jgi:hypothetical protein